MVDFGSWFSFVVGLVGVAAMLLLLVVQKRFRGGTIGKGFSLWVFAVFLWGVSMLQVGVMALFWPHEHTVLIHHGLMGLGLVMGLAGSYVFYRIPTR